MTNYPHKPAKTEADILPVIANRWSPVLFSPEPVEDEKVTTLFEAARWAPSSFNEQPWRYVYAQKGDENRELIENLLMDGNAWAKEVGLLMVIFSHQKYARNDKPNDVADYDTGCATGYLFLQLESLGLIGHEMGGFYKDKANNVLGVPSDYKPLAMMAIGYPGNRESAPAELREREAAERVRKPISEFVFREKWS